MLSHSELIGRIFICTNEKAPEKAQCLKGEGEKCAQWLKEEIEKRGLKSKMRATKTKCLGYCDVNGASLIFEPTHEQYSDVKLEDVPKLFEAFLEKLKI